MKCFLLRDFVAKKQASLFCWKFAMHILPAKPWNFILKRVLVNGYFIVKWLVIFKGSLNVILSSVIAIIWRYFLNSSISTRLGRWRQLVSYPVFLLCMVKHCESQINVVGCLLKFVIAENCRKRRKMKKRPVFWTRCCHGNDFQNANNNTNVIARMLLILLENFVNISHRGKKLSFLKHFSPI